MGGLWVTSISARTFPASWRRVNANIDSRSEPFGRELAGEAACKAASSRRPPRSNGPRTFSATAQTDSRLYDDETKRQQEINDALIKPSGNENQYKLHEEMGKSDDRQRHGRSYNDRLKSTDEKLLGVDGSLPAHLDQRLEPLGDEGSAARATISTTCSS
jgi:hypothetical protein